MNPRTTFAALVGGTALTALALAGCSGPSTDAAPKPASSNSAPTTTTQPTPAQWSAYKVCEKFLGDGGHDSLFWQIPDALTGIGAQMSPDTIDELRTINGQLQNLIDHAPSPLVGPLRTIQTPFAQVAEARESGSSGSITLQTGAVKDGIPELLAACTTTGYQVTATQSSPTSSADDPYPNVDPDVLDQAFVDGVRDSVGMEDYTDDQLVTIGHDVCLGFDKGASLDKLVDILMDSLDITTRDAATLAGSAIPVYCPEHSDEITGS